MSNPILQSEHFERAAHSLVAAFEQLSRNGIHGDIYRLENCTEKFRLSVDKLVTALGMQAENNDCLMRNETMIYTEADFKKL